MAVVLSARTGVLHCLDVPIGLPEAAKAKLDAGRCPVDERLRELKPKRRHVANKLLENLVGSAVVSALSERMTRRVTVRGADPWIGNKRKRIENFIDRKRPCETPLKPSQEH